MVREFQRCGRPEAGGSGAADGRTSGDRASGGGDRGRGLPAAGREELLPHGAGDDAGGPGVEPDLLRAVRGAGERVPNPTQALLRGCETIGWQAKAPAPQTGCQDIVDRKSLAYRKPREI